MDEIYEKEDGHCVDHQKYVLWPFQKPKAGPETWFSITMQKFSTQEGRDEQASSEQWSTIMQKKSCSITLVTSCCHNLTI